MFGRQGPFGIKDDDTSSDMPAVVWNVTGDTQDPGRRRGPARAVGTPLHALDRPHLSISMLDSVVPEISAFVSLLSRAGLASTVGQLTVFAPTNEAFTNLPDELLPFLQERRQLLTKLLKYHMLGNKVLAKNMRSGAAKTINQGIFSRDTIGISVDSIPSN